MVHIWLLICKFNSSHACCSPYKGWGNRPAVIHFNASQYGSRTHAVNTQTLIYTTVFYVIYHCVPPLCFVTVFHHCVLSLCSTTVFHPLCFVTVFHPLCFVTVFHHCVLVWFRDRFRRHALIFGRWWGAEYSRHCHAKSDNVIVQRIGERINWALYACCNDHSLV